MQRLMTGLLAAAILGIAGPAAAASKTTNATPILGPSTGVRGAAGPYPSTMQVSGNIGRLVVTEVTLHGVTTTSENDLDVVLESPSGQQMLMLSDAGGGGDITNGELEFRDSTSLAPENSVFGSGEYGPADYTGSCPGRSPSDDDDFLAPAPVPNTPSRDLHAFDGAFRRSQVNGTWKLYVMDDCSGDKVSINGGWTLNVLTIPGDGYINVPGSGTSGPASAYPINLPVSGLPDRVTKVTVGLHGPTHTHPDDLDVLLVGPTGATTELLSDAGGDNLLDTDDGDIFFADGAQPAPDSGALVTDQTYRPTSYDAGDGYPAPAPAGPYGTALSAFNGTNPNGTWRLFVTDDAGNDIGGLQSAQVSIAAASSGSGGGATSTTTVTGSATTSPAAKDTRAPGASLSILRGQTLVAALRKGAFGLTLRVDEPSRFTAQAFLEAAKASAAATKRPALVATGRGSIPKAGTGRVKLRFTKKGRRALKRRTRGAKLAVRVKVADRAGNRRLVKRTVKLRR